MDIFHDSDVFSTLRDAAMIQAVEDSESLSGTHERSDFSLARDIQNFSKYSLKGVSLTHHFALNESHTLVVTYNLSAVKNFYAIERIIKPNFLDETQSQVNELLKD